MSKDQYDGPIDRAHKIVKEFRENFRPINKLEGKLDIIPALAKPIEYAIARTICQAEAVIWRKCGERVSQTKGRLLKESDTAMTLTLLAREFEACANALTLQIDQLEVCAGRNEEPDAE